MAYQVGSVQQVPIKSPLDFQAEIQDQQLRQLSLQSLMKQRNAQIDATRAEQDEQRLLGELAQKFRHDNGRPDLDAMADAYIGINPDRGMAFKQKVNADRKAALDFEKARLENDLDVAAISARMLKGTLQNPQSYADVRKRLTLLDPDAETQLPPDFNPEVLSQIIAQADAFAGAQQEHGEALKLLMDGKLDDYMGWRLGSATSQEDVNAAYDDVTALTDAQTARALKHAYGDVFSPEFAQNVSTVRASRQPQKPSTEKPPAVGSFEDYVTRKFGPNPTPQQITQARKEYQQADDRPQGVGVTTLSPTSESNIVNRLTNQWAAAKKPAEELNRQAQLMKVGMEAARRGDMAQGSQAVLVTFQKILDPTSVVRESEYERSAAGQSLINRVRGAMERITQGGTGVRLEELEKFYTLAQEAVKAQTGAFLTSTRERIGRTADRYHIPREIVFEDLDVTTGKGADATKPADYVFDPATGKLVKKGGG